MAYLIISGSPFFFLCSRHFRFGTTRAPLTRLLGHGSRPGILVLINDADWELEGEESYELKSGDNILFVSTLHGG